MKIIHFFSLMCILSFMTGAREQVQQQPDTQKALPALKEIVEKIPQPSPELIRAAAVDDTIRKIRQADRKLKKSNANLYREKESNYFKLLNDAQIVSERARALARDSADSESVINKSLASEYFADSASSKPDRSVKPAKKKTRSFWYRITHRKQKN